MCCWSLSARIEDFCMFVIFFFSNFLFVCVFWYQGDGGFIE